MLGIAPEAPDSLDTASQSLLVRNAMFGTAGALSTFGERWVWLLVV